MTCKNCGYELSPEAKFCENCGAKLETENENTAQAVETPSEAPLTPTPKKSKKWLFIGIGIAAVILAVAIAYPFIKNALTPDDVYFKNAERANLKAEMELVAESLDKFNEMTADSAKDALDIYDSTRADVNLSLTLGDGIVKYLSDTAGIDLSFIKELDLGYGFAFKDDILGLGLSLGMENKQVLSADAVVDLRDFMTYLTIPELNSTTIKLDLEKLSGEDLSAALENAESDEITQNVLKLYEAFPEGKTLNSIVMRYFELALGHVKTVEKTKADLSAANLTKKNNAYTTVLTPDDLEALYVDILTEVKDDDELWGMLETLCEALDPEAAEELRYSRDDIVNSYDSIVSGIDGTFDMLGDLTYTAYIDSKGTILGRHVSFGNGDELMLSSLSDGDNIGFEFDLKEEKQDVAKIILSAVNDNGVFYGDAVISLEGNDMVKIEFKEVKEDGTSAEMIFTPLDGSRELLEATSDEIETNLGIDLDSIGVDLTDIAVTVTLDNQVSASLLGSATYTTTLTSGGEQIFTFETKAEYGKLDSLETPENYTEINDEEGFMNWFYSSDILGFIGNLPDGLSSILSALVFAGMQ